MFLLISVTTIFAQQAEKFDPAKDQKQMQGYVIHLVPVPGGTFGFTIIKGKKAVWSQLSNPFVPGQNGFKLKEDAYKLAEWIVSEEIKNGAAPKRFTPQLAKQLNINPDSSPH